MTTDFQSDPPRGATTTLLSIYKDHLLSCDAIKLECGGFRAQVAVISLKGDKTTSQRFIDVYEAYVSESEAKEKGQAAATEWVDTNGNKVDSGFYVSRVMRRL